MNHDILQTARRAPFLAVTALVFIGIACAVLVREGVEFARAVEAQPTSTPVVASHVAILPFADVIKAVGTAKANESVSVRSKVSDTITRVLFDSGHYVSEGQVLVELVNTEEAATLSEARATLAEAKRRSERISELSRKDFASAQLIDETAADKQRATAQVRAIEARLADRLIRAPISGVVGLRNISAGERIDTGTVIATLNDIEKIKLDFDVPERFLSALATGQTVEATASAYPARSSRASSLI